MTERIALVTGGSRGLGKNAALKLAADGTGIVLTYNRSQQEALEVVHEIQQKGVNAAALQLNVGDITSFDAFAQEVQEPLKQVWQRETFDYLLNNAGTGLYAPYTDTTEAQFDEALNIHFKGPFFLTQRLLPLLNDGGRILNVSSGLARFTQPGSGNLRGHEGGDGSADALSGERAGRARYCRQYHCAGRDRNRLWRRTRARQRADESVYRWPQTALGRVGLPDDIGDAIAALLSDKLGWMNAQRIEVSGGMFL